MKLLLLFFLSGFFIIHNNYAQDVKLYSPNRQIEVRISTKPNMQWSVYYKGKQILRKSKIALQVNNGYMMGVNQTLVSKKPTSIQNKEIAIIPLRNAIHYSYYKGMIFTFKVNNLRSYQIEFRVYDDGVAYRFITNFENELMIENEVVQLNFPLGTEIYFAQEHRYISRFEQLYQHMNMDTISNYRIASLPLLMKSQGVNMLFSEANLMNYPNMFMIADQNGSLTGYFPHVLKETRPDPKHPDRNEIFVRQKNEIAMTFGKHDFPWRYFIISDRDADLLDSEIPHNLASQSQIVKTDWIKPGKVVWDWYSANGIYQENFQKPINTETYKYYIDFASKYGFEYILMDEGWSKSTLEVIQSKEDIDMAEIIAYGKKKDVGVLLWLLWKPLDENMDSIMHTYNKWGIKGIKVDYMQRADQYMVDYYTRVAKTAAKYHLLVYFHGSYKPIGLSKAYPNVLTYEGFKGNKYNKWSKEITLEHTLILPFIRMAVGPMDFAPGAMRNAHPNNFEVSSKHPMSMGTRSRQVAMFVIYESPLQMLCDAPSLYEKEPRIPQIISRIPTTWDETKVLRAKLGKEIVIARRKKNTWYIAAMTDDTERDITIDLRKVLHAGIYTVSIIEDGEEAKSNAQYFETSEAKIASNQQLQIHMVAGGGYLAIFERTEEKIKQEKK